MNAPVTYDLSLLDRSHEKWRRSPALRAYYADLFAEIGAGLEPGRVLEIGSGIGVIREYLPTVVTSDVVPSSYVQRAVSAYDIPMEAWTGIVAVDVLHHLCAPLDFFSSAAAALNPGGRIILMEPAGTPVGKMFYSLFHPEPCVPAEIVPPFEFSPDAKGEFANMGMGHGLFTQHRGEVEEHLAGVRLRILSVRYRDVFAYPLTGGFSRPALLPARLLRALLAGERRLPQGVLRFLALRMVVVLEKTAAA